MCQVTVSIRKIWLEFQGGAIGCYGLWDVSRILMKIKNFNEDDDARTIKQD